MRGEFGRQGARVVDDQEITRREKRRQVGKVGVSNFVRGSPTHQQPNIVPSAATNFRGLVRLEFVGQRELQDIVKRQHGVRLR